MKTNKLTAITLLIALIFPIAVSAVAAFAMGDNILPADENALDATEQGPSLSDLTSFEKNDRDTGSNTTSYLPDEEPQNTTSSAPLLDETTPSISIITTTPEISTTTPDITSNTTPEAVTTTKDPRPTSTSATTKTTPKPSGFPDPISDGSVSMGTPVLSTLSPNTQNSQSAVPNGGHSSLYNTTVSSDANPSLGTTGSTNAQKELISGRLAAALAAVFASMTVISVLFFVFAKKG